jgi:hypothetical protein
MADKQDPAMLEKEFDVLMAANNLPVPQPWKRGAVNVYAELKKMCTLLREQRLGQTEISASYSLQDVLRFTSTDDGSS